MNHALEKLTRKIWSSCTICA